MDEPKKMNEKMKTKKWTKKWTKEPFSIYIPTEISGIFYQMVNNRDYADLMFELTLTLTNN